eukprot:comp22375_c1_seq1/m.33357 comp22375_c1_seq1/g.33357  ORF comp22375_c1_seq1/g.33357 comp22375_c1_seq1/m.33357 type:complete len:247 (-) comp22375_c1_seq1:315-1055(-)
MSKLEFLSPEGLRLDGRRPPELRKIVCRLGVFEQADGSAYVEMGSTKVLATIYGPHEAKSRGKSQADRAIINCEYSMATFSTGERKRRAKGDRRSVETAILIRDTFEAAIHTSLYPRSQIDIYVQVLQADGGQVSACINAATLALVDAGIPLKDYVTSCSAGLIDGKPILDLNYIEKSARGPELVLAVLSKSRGVIMAQMDQRLHVDRFEEVMELAIEGCETIMEILDKSVRERTLQLLASVTTEN